MEDDDKTRVILAPNRVAYPIPIRSRPQFRTVHNLPVTDRTFRSVQKNRIALSSHRVGQNDNSSGPTFQRRKLAVYTPVDVRAGEHMDGISDKVCHGIAISPLMAEDP